MSPSEKQNFDFNPPQLPESEQRSAADELASARSAKPAGVDPSGLLNQRPREEFASLVPSEEIGAAEEMENEKAQARMEKESEESAPNEVNDYLEEMGDMANFGGQGQERGWTNQINNALKEIGGMKSDQNKLEKMNRLVAKLKKLEKAARAVDAISTIKNYLAIMVETWWWTIIGAIIDIVIVIPTIFLAYWLGFVKGKFAKQMEALRKTAEKAKDKISAIIKIKNLQKISLAEAATLYGKNKL
ncbi:MAG: hypothetical protein WC430_02135 [Patescibacteria group bacterium]